MPAAAPSAGRGRGVLAVGVWPWQSYLQGTTAASRERQWTCGHGDLSAGHHGGHALHAEPHLLALSIEMLFILPAKYDLLRPAGSIESSE